MNNQQILDLVNEGLLKYNKAEYDIIYMAKFGSELYGLNTSNSDTDIVCIYLPSYEDLILDGFDSKKNLHYFTYKSKENSACRNTAEDFDIKYISIIALLGRLSRLEVEACDILFSYTNKNTIVYDDGFENIFNNYSKLIDIRQRRTYIGYCESQVRKYALKGTMLGIVQDILKNIEKYYNCRDKLETIFESVILPCLPKKSDVWEVIKTPVGTQSKQEVLALRLAQSVHQFTIPIIEFRQRMELFYKKFGERARQASQNENIDWKACSHALRSLINYKKLITNGFYEYPFLDYEHDLLMDIKIGAFPWKNFEKIACKYIDEINQIYSETKSTLDKEFGKRLLLKYY